MSQSRPRRRKGRHWGGYLFGGIIGLVAIAIAIAIATSGGVSDTPSIATGTPSTPAAHVAAPTRLGTYLDVQDSLGDTFGVALTKIIDPAHSTDRVAPDHGTRFVGAVFTIKGISGDGPQQEDADNDAALVGSDGRTYHPEIIAIAGYTDFAVGAIHAPPGESAIGALTFEVPTGVTVTRAQWSTFSSSGVGSTVQWNAPH